MRATITRHFLLNLLLGLILRLLSLSMSDIARKYNPRRNPNGEFVPGVGLHDLSKEEFAGLPKHARQSVDACGFYYRPRPTKSKDDGQADQLNEPNQSDPEPQTEEEADTDAEE